jgi:hypothetical protein
MIAVREMLPESVLDAIRRAPLSDEKVAFAWRFAVGPALARTTSVELRGTVLHVQARDQAWRREVERSTPLILNRLVSVLGAEVVARLRVQ